MTEKRTSVRLPIESWRSLQAEAHERSLASGRHVSASEVVRDLIEQEAARGDFDANARSSAQ